jgi:hypothetical protein
MELEFKNYIVDLQKTYEKAMIEIPQTLEMHKFRHESLLA